MLTVSHICANNTNILNLHSRRMMGVQSRRCTCSQWIKAWW